MPPVYFSRARMLKAPRKKVSRIPRRSQKSLNARISTKTNVIRCHRPLACIARQEFGKSVCFYIYGVMKAICITKAGRINNSFFLTHIESSRYLTNIVSAESKFFFFTNSEKVIINCAKTRNFLINDTKKKYTYILLNRIKNES